MLLQQLLKLLPPPLIGARHHGRSWSEGVQKIRNQANQTPVRPGLVLGVTFQDLIHNEVSGEQSRVPVKDVREDLLEALALLGDATVQPHRKHGRLLYAVLHDLSHT